MSSGGPTSPTGFPIGRALGLRDEDVLPQGRGKAKVDLAALTRSNEGAGRLILVSSINPAMAGEGKTSLSIGLAAGLMRLGKRATLSLRAPSFDPLSGVPDELREDDIGTGAGRSTLVPASDIRGHFTGDTHAVATTHNLLAAVVDNSLHFGDAFEGYPLDPKQIVWTRAMSSSDRALQRVLVGVGGKAHGVLREDTFESAAASEIMAILALSLDERDLESRLGKIVVGHNVLGDPVTATHLGAAGAMTALLRDALRPNLVQTSEGGAAFVHTSAPADVLHGSSSILATKLAMKYGDYAVTEAGFGFDMGGEKFLDVTCRTASFWPSAVVLVATLQGLRLHGGGPPHRPERANMQALDAGLAQIRHHVGSVRAFGLCPIVALRVAPRDPPEELSRVERLAAELGVPCAFADPVTHGAQDCTALARAVVEVVEAGPAPAPVFLYEPTTAIEEKIRTIAKKVYGADEVRFSLDALTDLSRVRKLRGERALVCVEKTEFSLTDDPHRIGVPTGFAVTVRSVRVAAGAGMIVARLGERHPSQGLGKRPTLPARPRA